MFTLIFNHRAYNFWKSGFLLDFFFKKFIFNILYVIYSTFNIFFSEKYVIEYTFLKIILYIDFMFFSINIFKNFFITKLIGFLFLLTIFLLIFTLDD